MTHALSLIVATVVALTWRSEPVRLIGVPAALPEGVRADLTKRRDEIRDAIRKHNQFLESLNARCAGVASSDSRFTNCRREQQDWQDGVTALDERKREFKRRVEQAIRDARLAPSVRFSNLVLSGDVRLQGPDGSPLDPRRLETLDIPLGTKILTGPTGSFRADAPGLHTLHLGAGGELTIDSVFVSPSSLRQLNVNLSHGFFRWIKKHQDDINSARQGGHFRVRTTTTAVAVRGTDVDLRFQPDGSGEIRLYDGEVVVTSPDSARRVTLKPGEMLRVKSSGEISDPTPLPPGVRPPPTESTYSRRRVP